MIDRTNNPYTVMDVISNSKNLDPTSIKVMLGKQ